MSSNTRSNERLEAQECAIMAWHEKFMEEYGTPASAKCFRGYFVTWREGDLVS